MTRINITATIIIATVCSLAHDTSAFSAWQHPSSKSTAEASPALAAALYASKSPQEQIPPRRDQSSFSRRSILTTILTGTITAASAATITAPSSAHAATSSTTASLITDLQTSLTKISEIPPLLQSAEWDKVRTILKTPPVNQLWNLGESSNTIVKLAKETGEFDLLEMKDELAISLQMTDQYSYDNVFIYYQPGNGKVKTKEPLDMANKAIVQLKEVLDVAEKLN